MRTVRQLWPEAGSCPLGHYRVTWWTMFIRKKGPYHYLCRSRRVSGSVRQEVVVYLGKWSSLKAAIDGTVAEMKDARQSRKEAVAKVRTIPADAHPFARAMAASPIRNADKLLAAHKVRVAYLRSVRKWISGAQEGVPPGPPLGTTVGDRVILFLDANRGAQAVRGICRHSAGLHDRQVERAVGRLIDKRHIDWSAMVYVEGRYRKGYKLTRKGYAQARRLNH